MMSDEAVARVVHEGMRAFKISVGQEPIEGWDTCPDWMRDSTIAAVRFRRDHPDAPPSAQHDQWLAEKEQTGWQYGPVRNDMEKRHPMMVPYGALPEVERRKDALVVQIIDALTGPML